MQVFFTVLKPVGFSDSSVNHGFFQAGHKLIEVVQEDVLTLSARCLGEEKFVPPSVLQWRILWI